MNKTESSPLYESQQMAYATLGLMDVDMELGDDVTAALRLLELAEHCISEAHQYFATQTGKRVWDK